MKLFLVSRQDLAPGLRAAQLCHAIRAFTEEHPTVDREWFTTSNTLVLLETVNEEELRRVVSSVRAEGIPVSEFLEPDLGDALTAIAVSPRGRHLLRRLPLAFGSLAMASMPIAALAER
jgi:siroheme synthase (precorrin-2 oxidase/ferrochelatase)